MRLNQLRLDLQDSLLAVERLMELNELAIARLRLAVAVRSFGRELDGCNLCSCGLLQNVDLMMNHMAVHGGNI
ncbi:hypothetical protein Dimus_036915 [Dionaea muscipula]